MNTQKKYKVIVIGSGPGASTSAFMLAEKGIDVLMIEQGSKFNLDEVEAFSSNEINKKYKNGGMTLAYGKSLMSFAEGVCLGGGSEVNSGLFHELPEEIINNWEVSNSLVFDRKLLKESYDFVREELSVSHMPEGKVPPASLKLEMGSKSLGWQCAEIPRWFRYEDDGTGKKQSMTETLIPKFLSLGGELITESEVLSIKKISNSTFSLDVFYSGEVIEYHADFVVLGAGAINSSKLLMNSKYSENIGKSLQFHPTFKLVALFDEEVNFKGMGVPVHQVKEFSPDISMGCSVSSKSLLSVSLNDTSNIRYLDKWKNLGSYYSMITPESRGRIWNIPFFKDPFISFSLTKKDYKTLRKGAKLLGELLFRAGAKKLFPSVNKEVIFETTEDLEILESIKDEDLNLMSIHLFGSIPMGGDPQRFPLSPDGSLWQERSIFVCDSSMLCSAPSVNPQATIMAISRMNTFNLINRINNEI